MGQFVWTLSPLQWFILCIHTYICIQVISTNQYPFLITELSIYLLLTIIAHIFPYTIIVPHINHSSEQSFPYISLTAIMFPYIKLFWNQVLVWKIIQIKPPERMVLPCSIFKVMVQKPGTLVNTKIAGYIMEGHSPKNMVTSFVLSHLHECSSFIPYDKMTNICLILYDMGFK